MLRETAGWIVRWEALWLLALAPLFLFPGTKYGLVIGVVPLLWGLRWVAQGRVVPRTPLDWSLALLLAMVGVSLWATFDPAYSLPKVTGVLLGVALYYALVAQAQSDRGLWRGVGLFVAVTSAIAVVSLLATQWTTKFPIFAPVTVRLPRVVRGLPGSPPDGFNPNTVAGALLLVFPLLVVLLWPYRNPAWQGLEGRWQGLARLMAWGAAALVGGTLLLTQSRAGYLGLLAGGVALVVLPRRRLLLATLLVGGLLALAALGQIELLQGVFQPASSQAAGLETVQGRLQLWGRAVYGIRDFPLTGLGMGMFRRVAPLLYPQYALAPEPDIGHAHNHLLNAGVDLGIPGLVAYLALWWGASALCRLLWRQEVRADYRSLLVGLAAGLVAHFVWGMFDTNALGSKAGLPFWLALAVLASLHRVASLSHSARSTEGSTTWTGG